MTAYTTATSNTGSVITSTTYTTGSPLDASVTIPTTESTVRNMIEKFLREHEPKVYKMTCQGCGAPIDQRINDHILKCPYCKSAYAIGTKMIYSR